MQVQDILAQKKLLLIVNPRSGTQQADKYVTDWITLFMDYGYRVEAVVTRSGEDASAYAAALGGSKDLIVCAGGDGTLSQTVHGMMQKGITTPLGYIPCGSTNDFAETLHLSSNVMTAAQDIMTGTPQPLDVGRFDDRHFCYCATFGAFTRTSYDTPQAVKNALGHLAYILHGALDLTSLKPEQVRVETEDRVMEGEYLFGAITNATTVGGMLTLKRDEVDLSDGLFEILLIKRIDSADALYRMLIGLAQMHYDPTVIEFARARKVVVKMPKPIPWSLDGEYCPGAPEVHIENLYHGMHLMVNTGEPGN